MFSSDKPILKMEADMLNRAVFAKQLAKAILSYSKTDNFTIGLCGKWGAGKTSIINMAVEEIQNLSKGKPVEEHMVIVHFNPWNYSDRSQLISQFFQTIFTELKVRNESEQLKEAGDALEKYSSLLEYTTYIPKIGKYISPIINAISNVGEKVSDIAEEKASLSNQKQVVIEALAKQTQKILIIIDDIDRLNNDQIRLIFQLVNSVAGFPNMIYLLAFDKSVVIRALEDEQKCNGEEYLEKIIQVPFDIPEVKYSQLQNIFFERIQSILSPEDYEFDQSHLGSVYNNCIAPFLESIRDVNRICNVFAFKYGLMNREANWIDLLAITTVQISAPTIFDWIKTRKSSLVGNSETAGGITGTAIKENQNNYFSEFKEIFPANPNLAIDIIQTLFPRFAWITGRTLSYEALEELQRNKRIASDRCFSLYFSLDLEEVEVSTSQVNASIKDFTKDHFHSFLITLNECDVIEYYLRELRVRVNEIPDDRVIMFFEELSSLEYKDATNAGIFSRVANPEYIGYDICFRLLRRLDQARCFSVLFDGISCATISSISMYTRIIRDIEYGYGRIDGSSNPIKCIVAEAQLTQLESKLLSAFKVFSESDEMFCSPRFDEITPTWHHLDPESLISYEKKSIQNINNIPAFIKRCTGSWQSATEGGPVYSEKYYCDVITLENLYKAVQQIIDSTEFASMSEELQNLTYGFFLWYNSKDREHNSHISNKTIREKRKQIEGI